MGAIVVIAASAGGLQPLRSIVAQLPEGSTASVFVAFHIGANRSQLPNLLSRDGKLPAVFARHNDLIQAGHIYVAPPDHHMLLGPGRIRLSQGPKVHFTRPAADPLFVSAAKAFRHRVIGVVLSGGAGDGAVGLREIKAHGGIALVQSPDEAEMPSMPMAAIAADHPDGCLPIREIAHSVRVFCSRYGGLAFF